MRQGFAMTGLLLMQGFASIGLLLLLQDAWGRMKKQFIFVAVQHH